MRIQISHRVTDQMRTQILETGRRRNDRLPLRVLTFLSIIASRAWEILA